MSYVYSDPSREALPHALPNVEVFYHKDGKGYQRSDYPSGWYWQACFPGCLPDSEPNGPFDTENEAIEAAQEEE
jgi:hypothetical protein